MICSGDAGVYGMAGVLFELRGNDAQVDIEAVPGVTAAVSGAACLGAPLMHDFAVISLSDLLTPPEVPFHIPGPLLPFCRLQNISSWRNQFPLHFSGTGISDKYRGKHICLNIPQFLQRAD